MEALPKGSVIDRLFAAIVRPSVQLRFDGPTLTINAPFRVLVQGRMFDKGALGYRDALCERIERLVRRTFTIPEKQLTVEFDDDSELIISLRPQDQVSPEAAILELEAVQVWVWR